MNETTLFPTDLFAGIFATYGYVPPAQPNASFIREVLYYIEQHPDGWDQGGYEDGTECGVTRCFAGWAFLLGTGKRWRSVDYSFAVVESARLLGLNSLQAQYIFGFVSVHSPAGGRRPTFAELVERVETVTGVKYHDDDPVGNALVAVAA